MRVETCSRNKEGAFWDWSHTFRCQKLVESQLNACYRDWMAGILSFILLIVVGSNTVSIRMNVGLPMTLAAITITLSATSYTFLIVSVPSRNRSISERVLGQKRAETSHPYIRTVLSSLRPIAVQSGSFGVIDKAAVLKYMASNIENTASLLLAL